MDEPQKPKGMGNLTLYIIVGVVLLAVAAWIIYQNSHQPVVSQNSGQQSQDQGSLNSNDALTASSTPSSTPAAIKAGGTKLSYGDAIKAYPERFQFLQCQGTPATIAVKKGTPVMLDNRDAVAHTIKADTQTFKLAGYGYEVFYPEVLGNLTVSCDGKPRVTLNVEK